jgi:hypothetical protein
VERRVGFGILAIGGEAALVGGGGREELSGEGVPDVRMVVVGVAWLREKQRAAGESSGQEQVRGWAQKFHVAFLVRAISLLQSFADLPR